MEQETGLSGCWETYFQQLQQLVLNIESRDSTQESLELLRKRTTAALQSLHAISSAVTGSRIKTILHRVNSNISDILSTLKRELISFKPQNLAVCQFYNVTENRGQAGRPRVRIEEEILFHFRNIGHSWKEIAELLLVSRWTLLRRVSGLGNYFVCKRFAVQTLLWSLEFVTQINLEHDTIAV